jgi:hypothetical protein
VRMDHDFFLLRRFGCHILLIFSCSFHL